ncbi:MAG: class Ib ribonucleoside-diphosphate reductase assembly flavoprotein NrdI [Erysipelotrichaceae bacterium]|nr:class Ib ribonucleoside-diphosphate reductase assembly flavoprotein NrdI [Erysipelotrichaceae bacterium]MCD7949841.1 class Ib ribonucleoside-diphosphate reductase assembly flavoprotein NrdI [Erysipelotrichaceae bacterium]
MKIAYASRTGNVESIVNNLGYDDALRIDDGSETIEEEYVLFTYTDGFGDIPMEVESFLEGNADFLQGVVVSGDKGYGEAYCQAGDKIAEMYNVDVLYRVENDGTDDDLAAIEAKLAEL